jgi:hypothetical protein
MMETRRGYGPVAQLGARFHGMEEVKGSNPFRSTNSHDYQTEMIQVNQGGITVEPGAITKLSADYHEKGFALMPGFLAPSVLKPLLRKVASGQFGLRQERYVEGATLLMPATDAALISLHFIVNRPELCALVSQITGVPVPGHFFSRLHCTTPAPGQHLDWHDDGSDGRVLGMNINLSTASYEGGRLQMRNPAREITGEIGQLPAGDAFLFRIADKWQHRLTPVERGSRTVAVGWFRSKPDWVTMAKSAFGKVEMATGVEAN